MKVNFLKYISIFVLVSSLVSCNALVSQSTLPIELKRQWMLTSLVGYSKENLMKNQAQLHFRDNPKAFANLGCGDFSIKVVEVNHQKIILKTLDHLNKNCSSSDGVEYVFREEIARVNRYEVSGHFLKLFDNEKIVMVFVASDWD